MTDQELIKAGSMACLGCGYEHSCCTHGCAIIRKAADRLEVLIKEKIPQQG